VGIPARAVMLEVRYPSIPYITKYSCNLYYYTQLFTTNAPTEISIDLQSLTPSDCKLSVKCVYSYSLGDRLATKAWVAEEFSGMALGDEKLDKRAKVLMEWLLANPRRRWPRTAFWTTRGRLAGERSECGVLT